MNVIWEMRGVMCICVYIYMFHVISKFVQSQDYVRCTFSESGNCMEITCQSQDYAANL